MKSVLILAAALMALAACSPPDLEDDTHNTFVLVHGASGGGWDWRTVDNLLSADGHTVYRPTLTGLGERMHLSTPNVDLTTHIDDITNVILFENLDNVVLVGHSYGGMVITGVMNRIPQRIKHAIFLDAAVPEDGMSAKDLWPGIDMDHEVADGLVHFSWLPTNKSLPRDVPQSLKTLTEPVSFNNPEALGLPATLVVYVAPDQSLEQRRAGLSWRHAEARKWTILTLESDHNAQRSHPVELVDMLEERALTGSQP